MDWNTPLGKTRIVDKRKNPTWSPPESVRKEHAERGDPLPAVVKAGPDNPLGAYAMRLGITPGAYLIHGTNNPIAVGMAITHGCIRMYPEDIEALFPLVPVNTPVWLINEPVKVARVGGQVWLEVHPPVDAEGQRAEVDIEGFYALANAALGETPAAIHWDFVLSTLKEASGLPQMIGLEIDPDSLPAPPEVPSEPVPAQVPEPVRRRKRPRSPRRADPAARLKSAVLISARTSAMRAASAPGSVATSSRTPLSALRIVAHRLGRVDAGADHAPRQARVVGHRLDHDLGPVGHESGARAQPIEVQRRTHDREPVDHHDGLVAEAFAFLVAGDANAPVHAQLERFRIPDVGPRDFRELRIGHRHFAPFVPGGMARGGENACRTRIAVSRPPRRFPAEPCRSPVR